MSLPPGPRSPAVLQTLALMRSPVLPFERAAKRFGDLFTVRNLVFGTQVITSDPELIKQIFTGDPDVFHAGEANSAARFLTGENSLLVLDGKAHLRERRLMLPPFHGERMHAYAETMRDVTERIVAGWVKDKPFPLMRSFQRITLEIIVITVFGLTQGPRHDQLLAKLAELMGDWLGSPIGVLLLIPAFQRDLGPLWPWRAFKKLNTDIDALIYEEIKERRAELALAATERPSDVLSILLEARHEDGQGMTDKALRDELITLLGAGHETTATSLAWAFERILGHPDVKDRLTAELDAAIAEGKTSADDLARLPYLDATIKEVLRQRSPIPTVGRILKRPVVLQSYEIPAGTMVSPSPYLTHRRPDLYPDPEAFRPERFLDKKTDPYTFIPFGGGVRRCLGMAFALYEMKIVVATVLLRVRLRLVKPAPLKVTPRSLFFAPEGGTEVVVLGER